jgi:hypothetical protein
MDKRGDHFMGIKATLEKVTEKVGVDGKLPNHVVK